MPGEDRRIVNMRTGLIRDWVRWTVWKDNLEVLVNLDVFSADVLELLMVHDRQTFFESWT